MRALSVTHPVFEHHDTGRNHPERSARLQAALRGVDGAPVDVVDMLAPEVDRDLLEVVHRSSYVAQIESFCRRGGGALDADTHAVRASWEAALRSAGAGPAAIEALEAGTADTAFLTVRPPGHHALTATAMGFCLFNNIAVAARMLTARGDRVAVVDWDVHHGNGSEEMFAPHDDILYLSFHQYPFYPGTGWLGDMGTGPTAGTTINIPFPAGTAGDVYRQAFPQLVEPALRAFDPDWVLVSAGYDAFAGDPLAELRLLPSDYAYMSSALAAIVPTNRTLFFLEGGYDLDGIRTSVSATLAGSAGVAVDDEELRYESPSSAFAVLDEVTSSAGSIWGF
jgi:acetoin utilization deacetylase AcuC-like enzyme